MANVVSSNTQKLMTPNMAPAVGQLSRIRREMEHVSSRYRSKQFWLLMGIFGVVAICFAAMFRGIVASGQLPANSLWTVIGVLISLTVLASFFFARRLTGNEEATASRIERAFPDLGQRLLTMVELPDAATSRPLTQHLIRQTHDHFRKQRWSDMVSNGSLWTSRFFGIAALGVALSLGYIGRGNSINSLIGSQGVTDEAEETIQVLPGNVMLERGSNLVITAEFSSNVPEQVVLETQSDSGAVAELLMEQRLVDPIVAGFLPAIEESFSYRVKAGDWQSETYRVDVFEFPALVRSDAVLEFPKYTGRKNKTIEDTRKVSVVEGTKVEWKLRLNKPVTQCMLKPTAKEDDGSEKASIACELESLDPPVYRATFETNESLEMKLFLVDEAERQNKFPPKLSIRVLPNKPPKIRVKDARDKTVSALQEVPFQSTIQDDFGIVRAGWEFTHQGESFEKVLTSESSAKSAIKKLDLSTQLDFESIEAKPDDLVTYSFWVEDIGADGDVRRTSSDLYFVDVRPFDEIFRRGSAAESQQQQSQQQQQGSMQQMEQTLDNQKKIVIALWNLIRASTEAREDDLKAIADSQAEVAQQFQQAASELQDENSAAIAEEVLEQMATSEAKTLARESKEARVASEAAIAGLLKLRAREFEITRQQRQQQQGGQGGNSRQRQLNELELDDEEDRYELQREASAQDADSPQAAEDRQVLSRLRELAKRVEDLTEELAELQTALEKAKTEEEKEEVRRRLERLREQQQELLRSADDLESRMRSEENSERMSEQADQLQQSREQIREAAEATENDNPSAALAAGRRAEERLNELEDEFQNRAAGAFNETLQEMQRKARELDETQDRLREAMAQETEVNSPGLRGEESSGASSEAFEEQAERLGELLEQVKQTIEDAEESEPLMAERLYEGFRDAAEAQADRELRTAAELVRRGFLPQAEPFERRAGEAIEELREEIDSAAEAVLGDSTEGLRRAADQLSRLSDAVDGEVQQGRGGQTDDSEAADGAEAGRNRNDQSDQSRRGSDDDSSEQGSRSGGSGKERSEQQDSQAGDQRASENQRRSSESQDSEQRRDSEQDGESQQGGNAGGNARNGEQRQDGQRGGGQSSSQDENQESNGQNPSNQNAPGQNSPGQNQSGQDSPGQNPTGENTNGQRTRPGLRPGDDAGNESRRPQAQYSGGQGSRFAADSPEQQSGPITGDFREWSDRMRDVEEMVGDPELRNRAVTIRDRVRQLRVEQKRHGGTPKWELVEDLVARPLRELQRDVRAELLRRTASKNELVPIDREAVPDEFTGAVQRYYENLSRLRVGEGEDSSNAAGK
ncbi:MAG: hypothetical protein AAF802_11770 [Planctomycetota bacterium]